MSVIKGKPRHLRMHLGQDTETAQILCPELEMAWQDRLCGKDSMASDDARRLGLVTDESYWYGNNRLAATVNLLVAQRIFELFELVERLHLPQNYFAGRHIIEYGVGEGHTLAYAPTVHSFGLETFAVDFTKKGCRNARQVLCKVPSALPLRDRVIRKHIINGLDDLDPFRAVLATLVRVAQHNPLDVVQQFCRGFGEKIKQNNLLTLLVGTVFAEGNEHCKWKTTTPHPLHPAFLDPLSEGAGQQVEVLGEIRLCQYYLEKYSVFLCGIPTA